MKFKGIVQLHML